MDNPVQPQPVSAVPPVPPTEPPVPPTPVPVQSPVPPVISEPVLPTSIPEPQPVYTPDPVVMSSSTTTTSSMDPMQGGSETTVQTSLTPPTPGEKSGSNRMLIMIIILLVIFLLAGVLALVILTRNDATPTNTNNEGTNNTQDGSDSTPQNQLTAIEFNDTLVANQKKVVEEFLKYTAESQKTDATLSEVMAVIGNSKTAINQALTNLQQVNFTGGESFKASGVALFEFYSSALDVYVEPMIEAYFSTTLNTVQKNAEIAKITSEFTAAEKILVDAFQAAQQSFATANNITLVNKEPNDVNVSASEGLQK